MRRKRTKHGMSFHPLYWVWNGMWNRCARKNVPDYERYGGRGIIVCDEWNDPATFFRWAASAGYKKGLQIDRIDNSKGYHPENCRFVTSRTNNLNQRFFRVDNKTGYRGVHAKGNRFCASAGYKGTNYHIGYYGSALAAAIARDSYIKKNKFDLPLNFPACISSPAPTVRQGVRRGPDESGTP
jgi:hypothetical protein